MKKRMTIMLIAVGILLGSVLAWNVFRTVMMNKFFASMEAPAITVSATTAENETWQSYISAVGSLVAINGIDISAEVGGLVEKIHFNSGQLVEKGDLLITLRDDIDQAELVNNQANLKLKQLSYKRYRDLFDQNVATSAELDEAQAALEQAEAMVAKTMAQLRQKNISAPFSGQLGIRQASLGEYVAAGTALVNLQSLDPIFVDFSLPEQHLPRLAVNQPIEIIVDAYDEAFRGRVTAINAKVDPNSRNVLIQATVSNDDLKLVPGMYANIKVMLPKQNNVVTIPETAVSFSLYGESIFVINQTGETEDGQPILTAERIYVLAGEQRNNRVVILEGINAGDLIIVSGQLKLGEGGARVVINNDVDVTQLPDNTDALY